MGASGLQSFPGSRSSHHRERSFVPPYSLGKPPSDHKRLSLGTVLPPCIGVRQFCVNLWVPGKAWMGCAHTTHEINSQSPAAVTNREDLA